MSTFCQLCSFPISTTVDTLPGNREFGLKIWLFVGWPNVCLLGDKYRVLPPAPLATCWGRLSTLLCLRFTTDTLACPICCCWFWFIRPSDTMLDLLEDELLDLKGLPWDWCWSPMLAARWSWLFDMFLISMWTLLDGSDLWLRSDWLMDLEIHNEVLFYCKFVWNHWSYLVTLLYVECLTRVGQIQSM